MHVGVHDEPLARELVQLPTTPLVGAVDASHEEAEVGEVGEAERVAAVKAPALHEEPPETV